MSEYLMVRGGFGLLQVDVGRFGLLRVELKGINILRGGRFTLLQSKKQLNASNSYVFYV